MSHKTTVLISDTHIGGEDLIEDFSCEQELISFLDHLDKNYKELELIILGDFFDLWKVEERGKEQVNYIIKKWQKLFDKFKEFGKKHEVTLLGGNHDHELVYEKKFQDDLAKYNIKVVSDQFFVREFHHNNKKVTLAGEHGSQIDPNCSFDTWDMETNSSMAYHVNRNFVFKIMQMGIKEDRPEWVRDTDNMEIDIIPFWFLSKYFYNELGPILKAIIIPMLILFGLALPYFIFDIATDFYRPNFLVPLLDIFDTNIYFKILIFILYFDMVLVVIFFFLALLRKDFQKKLHKYGFHDMSETLYIKHQTYMNRAKEFLQNNKNPLNKGIDIFVNGHTHCAGYYDDVIENKVYVDTGSWKQLMQRLKTRFRFPSVYYPYYKLTYLICDPSEKGVIVELKEWPKEFKPKLTILEKIAIKKAKNAPKPLRENKVLNSRLIQYN